MKTQLIGLFAAATLLAVPAAAQDSSNSELPLDNNMAMELAEKLPAMSEAQVSDCAMSMAILANALPEGDARYGARASQQIFIIKMGIMTEFDEARSDKLLSKGTIFNHLSGGGQIDAIMPVIESKQDSCLGFINSVVNG